ncbi:MAG: hypothetical protein ACP5PA_01670 [Elusimicrobiales bacterium]
MRYWVFVNNCVEGPFTIKEIVEKNYVYSNLLVCPSEMSAEKPSSWYFAKELSEFDPYIEGREASVAVEDFDLHSILNLSTTSQLSKTNEDDYDVERIVEEERRRIESRDLVNYREKIYKLERNIKELDEKLSKALSVIKEYEESLKAKDSVIERLENEIEEIKKLREEDKKIFDEKIKSYEKTLKEKETEIEDLKKEIQFHRSNLLKEPQSSDNEAVSSLTQTTPSLLNIDNNITQIMTFDVGEGSDDNKEEEKKEIVLPKDLDFEDTNKISKKDSDSKSSLQQLDSISFNEIKTLNNTSTSSEKENLMANSKSAEMQSEGSSDKIFTQFKPLKKIDSSILIEDNDSRSNVLDSIDIPVASLQSEKTIENEALFQIADVSFESVETKLDKIETSRIEPIPSSPQAIVSLNDKVSKEIDKEAVIEKDLHHEISSCPIKPLKRKEDTDVISKENSKDEEVKSDSISQTVQSVELNQPSLSAQGDFKSKDTFVLPKGSEIKADDKFFTNKDLQRTKERSITIREKKGSRIILVAGVGVIVFFFALVYILRSGGDVNQAKIQSIANIYQTQVSSQTPVSKTIKELDQATNSVSEKEDEIKIAKINENVKNAIEIVKNHNLGDGKGSIERWLSNTVASGVRGKEEWNATYLSGSVFVVQYRFLRYRAEPVVYLFEVDVDKKEIVRGINNNAINLLAGKKNSLTKSASIKRVGIDKHIESDDEMF